METEELHRNCEVQQNNRMEISLEENLNIITQPNKQSNQSLLQSLNRPNSNECLNLSNDFQFMLIDIDYKVFDIESKTDGRYNILNPSSDENQANREPIFQLYGVTKDQNSVLVNVRGIEPYIHVEIPSQIDPNQETLKDIQRQLNKQRNGIKKQLVKRIEVVNQSFLTNSTGKLGIQQPIFKIFTYFPSEINTVRQIFEKGFAYKGVSFNEMKLESNLPFITRYMIDANIAGMSWIKLDMNSIEIISNEVKQSRCSIEINTLAAAVLPIESLDPQCSIIAPLRIMSFDIQYLTKTGDEQLNQQKNEIIQISTVLKVLNSREDESTTRIVYSIKSIASISDCIVKSFESENELLLEWEQLIHNYDPDIILGFDSGNFGFPNLFQRANRLDLINSGKFGYFGRIKSRITQIKENKLFFQGTIRENFEMNIDGRIHFDLLTHLTRETKLNNYSLNSASSHLLGEEIEEINNNSIQLLFESNDETRKRLGMNSLKKASIQLRLFEHLNCNHIYTEICRTTGVPYNYLLNKGQQIKVITKLSRYAKEIKMIVPQSSRAYSSPSMFEGSVMLGPKLGFYNNPITVLHFDFLYPKIIIAYNLCYSTLISKETALTSYEQSDYTITPTGHYFVKTHIRKGVLPMILEDILGERELLLNNLKSEVDSNSKIQFESRLDCLKVLANSFYGFIGSQAGQLPCLEISAAVQRIGNLLVKSVSEEIQKEYSTSNGFQWDSDIIYGDSRSIMIKFGSDSILDLIDLGKTVANRITKKILLKPITLEYKQVLSRFLLFGRSRYAGCSYTDDGEEEEKIVTKGFGNVRLGSCKLVQEIIDTCLQFILKDNDKVQGIQLAVDYVKRVISELYMNKVDISKLILTKPTSKFKKIEDNSENENENVFMSLADRIEQTNKLKEDPFNSQNQNTTELEQTLQQNNSKRGSGIVSQNVTYNWIKNQNSHERAEDPMFVLQNNIPIDFEYYVQNQIKRPISLIFSHLIANVDSLFVGDHTRVRVMPPIKMGFGLGKFIVKKEQCLLCKSPMDKKSAVCNNCLSNNPEKVTEMFAEKILENTKLENRLNDLKIKCQSCSGNNSKDEFICSNRQCSVLYQRFQVENDLSKSQEIIRRINDQK